MYYVGSSDIHKKTFSESFRDLGSMLLVEDKGRILQHSSHFLHGEPCQSIWQIILLSGLIPLNHSLGSND